MRILVTGASGQLGRYVLNHLITRGVHQVCGWASVPTTISGLNCQGVPLTHESAVTEEFRRAQPDCVLHLAALSRVDLCCQQPDLARRVNEESTGWLAELARECGARFVYTSTDLVFDGRRGNYAEQDVPAPLSQYGRTKLAGESRALRYDGSLVARLSLLFGPSWGGKPSFFDLQTNALQAGQPIKVFTDEWRTPLSLVAAATALADLAESRVTGILHLGGLERLSRWDMGARLVKRLGCQSDLLVATRQAELSAPEPRPADVSLNTHLWQTLCPQAWRPGWDEALDRMAGR